MTAPFHTLASEAAAMADTFRPAREEKTMNEWQTIETAPKDGTSILCVCAKTKPGSERYLGVMAVDSWKERYRGFGQFNNDCWPATHWMPLPDLPPPTKATEAQP